MTVIQSLTYFIAAVTLAVLALGVWKFKFPALYALWPAMLAVTTIVYYTVVIFFGGFGSNAANAMISAILRFLTWSLIGTVTIYSVYAHWKKRGHKQ
jgi:hypothetical protein